MTREQMLERCNMLNVREMLHLGLISQDDYDWFYDIWVATFRYTGPTGG